MRRIALLALVLVGCGDAAASMDAGCSTLSPAPGVPQPCVYAVPADVECAAVKSVRVDGVPMEAGTYGIQCGGNSLIWLQPHGQERCSEWVVDACQ